MLHFYAEPIFGDLPKGQPTSTVIANSVPIGINDLANPYVSSFHYCEVREGHIMYIVPTYQATEGNVGTVAYFNDTTDKWTTVAGKTPIEQIVCDDGLIATSTLTISIPTSTASSTSVQYTGANLNEWLFVVGVVLFFISFLTWGRFNFLKI
jgi:hypothetical protein